MTPKLPLIAHRIARREHCATPADALSGEGGRHAEGRWHTKGTKILYAAQSLSLCLLERLVHGDEGPADRNSDRVSLEIALPSVSFMHFDADELAAQDPNWRAEGNLLCRALGDMWLGRTSSCALLVPSAVNYREFNILLNPAHPEFAAILAANARLNAEPLDLDERVVPLMAARYGRSA